MSLVPKPRNKLTDYWSDHEIKGEQEYAILTNIIHQEWSGVSVTQHKTIKGFKTQNLRDHMFESATLRPSSNHFRSACGRRYEDRIHTIKVLMATDINLKKLRRSTSFARFEGKLLCE